VFEINSYSSVPLNKIVIGKPLDVGSASNGYMSAETLNSCVKQATQKGWNGGVMYWEWQKSLASLSMLAVIA
jgi:chitinase